MITINSKKLVELLDSVSNVVDEDISGIATDSRNIFEGDLFIAIKGDKFDGHEYVKEALEKGAVMMVVSRLAADVPAVRQILVEDTLAAYGKIGAYVRSKYKGTLIGLTGSSGKTTLKEELRFVLSKFAPVYATEENFNNAIGVPKTLCGLDMNSKYAVVEMGMSAAGEIARLTSYAQPDIAIVSNVYPMHIEFFKDGLEGIAKAKAEIFEGLKKDGVAIINADTNFPAILIEKAKKQKAKLISFGEKNITRVREQGEATVVDADFDGKKISYKLVTKGRHHVYNSLCVLSVAEALGLSLGTAADSLKSFEELSGRGKRHKLRLPSGGEYTLIDDSYSGQPEAMKLAIANLDSFEVQPGGRKIAVLGKMAELGEYSTQAHEEIGGLLADSGIDIVVGVCPESKDILAKLPKSKAQHYFENKEGLDEFLLNKVLQNNDIVLIKGAHYSSKLFEVAASLVEKGKA